MSRRPPNTRAVIVDGVVRYVPLGESPPAPAPARGTLGALPRDAGLGSLAGAVGASARARAAAEADDAEDVEERLNRTLSRGGGRAVAARAPAAALAACARSNAAALALAALALAGCVAARAVGEPALGAASVAAAVLAGVFLSLAPAGSRRGLSAYSHANAGGEALAGELKAEHWEAQLRGGAGAGAPAEPLHVVAPPRAGPAGTGAAGRRLGGGGGGGGGGGHRGGGPGGGVGEGGRPPADDRADARAAGEPPAPQ